MTSLPPLSAAKRGDLAVARADLTLPAASAETLLKEVRAVDDRVQDAMANRARNDGRDQARTALHTARLDNMQAGLRRLMGANYAGPTVVAVLSDTAGRDAVAVQGAVVDRLATGDGADAIAIAAGTVQGVMAGAGNDRVAIAAVVVSDIYGGDGADDILVNAVTGMAHNLEPETDGGRAMG